tara:strand:- start:359 stop:775 length:417 start_codon:yes stop_codon:yes gene_type:complete
MQYWLILYEQEDGTYKYYIGQSGDGASVCKLTFADDGSEYKPPSGKTLLKVAREEATNPTPPNGEPLVKGPFNIGELKIQVNSLHDEELILDEHLVATVFMAQQQGAGRKRRRKSKKKKRKSTKKKKKSKRNKSRRRR